MHEDCRTNRSKISEENRIKFWFPLLLHSLCKISFQLWFEASNVYWYCSGWGLSSDKRGSSGSSPCHKFYRFSYFVTHKFLGPTALIVTLYREKSSYCQHQWASQPWKYKIIVAETKLCPCQYTLFSTNSTTCI